jgi:hypothetical protein
MLEADLADVRRKINELESAVVVDEERHRARGPVAEHLVTPSNETPESVRDARGAVPEELELEALLDSGEGALEDPTG